MCQTNSYWLSLVCNTGCIHTWRYYRLLVLLCLQMHYSAAPPRRSQSFCTFSSLPPRFWSFSCVSLVQMHVWRICIVLIVLLLVWFKSLVPWNGPRARHQVVLSLVSLLPFGKIKAPNLPFCWGSNNSVISEPNLMKFSIKKAS